jgi:hypothetical protein
MKMLSKYIGNTQPYFRRWRLSKEMRLLLTICLTFVLTSALGQSKVRLPLWTFNTKNTKVYGLGVGYTTTERIENVKITGIRLELVGLGMFLPLIPEAPIAENDSLHSQYLKRPYAETINGINLSPIGTGCDCKINGLNIYGAGSMTEQVNGISTGLFMNVTERQNGVQGSIGFNITYELNGAQIALIGNSNRGRVRGAQISAQNETRELKGLQIGLVNKTSKIKGIQLGLWNVNDKRKRPLINWNFRDYPVLSLEEEMRIQDSLLNMADSVRTLKQTERQNLTSMKIEAGALTPLGNLNRVMGVSPHLGFWVERGLSKKRQNTSLAIGISLFTPLQSRVFTYTLPDTVLKARAKGASGIIGLQGAHSFQVKSTSILDHIDLLVGAGFGFLKTDQVMPTKDKEGNHLYYYVHSMQLSGGVTFRKMLTKNKSVGLNLRYNFAPPALISNNVSNGFGGSSLTSSLQFRLTVDN